MPSQVTQKPNVACTQFASSQLMFCYCPFEKLCCIVFIIVLYTVVPLMCRGPNLSVSQVAVLSWFTQTLYELCNPVEVTESDRALRKIRKDVDHCDYGILSCTPGCNSSCVPEFRSPAMWLCIYFSPLVGSSSLHFDFGLILFCCDWHT